MPAGWRWTTPAPPSGACACSSAGMDLKGVPVRRLLHGGHRRDDVQPPADHLEDRAHADHAARSSSPWPRRWAGTRSRSPCRRRCASTGWSGLPISGKPNVILFSTNQYSVVDNFKYGIADLHHRRGASGRVRRHLVPLARPHAFVLGGGAMKRLFLAPRLIARSCMLRCASRRRDRHRALRHAARRRRRWRGAGDGDAAI